MGDAPEFNPCDCLTYHDLAMRRLLSMVSAPHWGPLLLTPSLL